MWIVDRMPVAGLALVAAISIGAIYLQLEKWRADFDARQAQPKPVCLDLDFDARLSAYNACAANIGWNSYASECSYQAERIACKRWDRRP